jgi:drug/metabolite transporter (DMT)-like permease
VQGRPFELPNAADAHRPTLAVVGLAIAVVLWGLNTVAIKLIAPAGLVVAVYRLWFAIPLLWGTALAPSVRRRLDGAWLRASIVGGMLFSVHQVLFFTSLKLTTVANVAIIGALQPSLVLLVAGPMFGERVTPRALAWSLVAFVGTALVIVGAIGAPSWSPLGDALAGLNLFAFTAYFLASKRFRARVPAWEYVVGMTTVAGVVILGVALATGQDLGSPRGWEWVVLLGIAIFPGTLGHVLLNWAHAWVSAFVSSMLLLAIPLVAAAGAVAFLDERLGVLQIAGAVVVVIAIANVVLSTSRPTAAALAESVAATDAP